MTVLIAPTKEEKTIPENRIFPPEKEPFPQKRGDPGDDPDGNQCSEDRAQRLFVEIPQGERIRVTLAILYDDRLGDHVDKEKRIECIPEGRARLNTHRRRRSDDVSKASLEHASGGSECRSGQDDDRVANKVGIEPAASALYPEQEGIEFFTHQHQKAGQRSRRLCGHDEHRQ